MKSHPLLVTLEKACAGLTFPSETDAAMIPFLWEDGGALTAARLLQFFGHEEGTPVETMDLPDFFLAIPKEDRPAFDALVKALHENLAAVKVYKVGQIQMKAYIVGKTNDGFWAGVQTEIVET
jgi:hypothetical protein